MPVELDQLDAQLIEKENQRYKYIVIKNTGYIIIMAIDVCGNGFHMKN